MRYFLLFPACLIFVSSCQHSSRLRSVITDDGIAILEGDSNVLFYQVKPKSLDGKFERASYIHPLYSLDGSVITEDFPDDHPHHHGIYSAWHQISLFDKQIGDGWTGENISWSVVDTGVSSQDKSITIKSEVLWNAVLEGQTKEAIVDERLKIAIHESNDKFRIIDYDIVVLPLKEGIKLGGSNDEKGYGGFSLRFKLPEDVRFLAKGQEVQPKVISVDAGPWMNFVGSFDGPGKGPKGVVVFCHPRNPGSPQPWILRKEKSMQNPAYPGRVPVELKKEGLTLRYRMVIHNGGLDEPAIEELYSEYSKSK
jgi:hypothetical protein